MAFLSARQVLMSVCWLFPFLETRGKSPMGCNLVRSRRLFVWILASQVSLFDFPYCLRKAKVRLYVVLGEQDN